MALNLSFSPTPWTIFFIALILVVAAIIVLTIIERRLNKRVFLKRIEEENSYQKKINLLKESKQTPEKLLFSIDGIAREFFESKYKLDRNQKYSILIEIFRKKGDRAAMRFCERMQEALYAGEAIDNMKTTFLLGNLEFLVNSEKGILKDSAKTIPKQEIEKKEARASEEKEKKIEAEPDMSRKMFFTAEEEKEIEKIKRYLEEGLGRKFSLNFLRHKLLEGGFNDDEIKEAVFRIKSTDKSLNIEDEAPKQKPELIPYKEEKFVVQRTKGAKDSPFVRGVDNLERVENKIKERKKYDSGEFTLV